jgi:hypothetical protein
MRNEQQRLEIITEHYKKWIDTATDEYHKAYAQIMLSSIYNERYKETFQELSKVSEFNQPKFKWSKLSNLEQVLKNYGL